MVTTLAFVDFRSFETRACTAPATVAVATMASSAEVIELRMVFSCRARAPSADVPRVRDLVNGGREPPARHAEENRGAVLRGTYRALTGEVAGWIAGSWNDCTARR